MTKLEVFHVILDLRVALSIFSIAIMYPHFVAIGLPPLTLFISFYRYVSDWYAPISTKKYTRKATNLTSHPWFLDEQSNNFVSLE